MDNNLYIKLIALLLFALPAKADWVTEIGIGYKLDVSSAILHPKCTLVDIPLSNPLRSDRNSPHWGRSDASCGGDNPVFIGYPIRWESNMKGPWQWFGGWFHFSSFADGGNLLDWGGDRHEVHMDALVIGARFNWSERSRLR